MQLSELSQTLISGESADPYEARLRNLADALGLQKLLIHEESLAAGKSGSRAHCHSQKEELIFVLEGNVDVILGAQTSTLGPGEFVGFKPGSQEFHQIRNSGSIEARYLSIASVSQNDDVIYRSR